MITPVRLGLQLVPSRPDADRCLDKRVRSKSRCTLTVIAPVSPSSEFDCFWNQRIVGSESPTHIAGSWPRHRRDLERARVGGPADLERLRCR
jgi:hypothetical protein